MKQLLLLTLLLHQLSSGAQPVFYGVRNLWNGEFLSYDVSTKTSKLLYSIDNDGYGPNFGPLLKASDSKWYGTTQYGGSFNGGTIFRVDPATGQFTRLANFKGPGMANPLTSLVEVPDGRLFGTAFSQDTIHPGGVIYSFDPQSNQLTLEAEVIDENHSDGGRIREGLAYADGKLYGATYGGTGGEAGMLFSFDIIKKELNIIHRFPDEANTENSSGLVFGSDGRLYGVNDEGGITRTGELYAFDVKTSSLEVVHSFRSQTGFNPKGTPALATDGKLYGIAASSNYAGDNVIYSYDPSSGIYDTVAFFEEGFRPEQSSSNGITVGLVTDGNKHLFGYSNRGLYTFNTETKKIELWQKTPSLDPASESSTCAFIGPEGIINIGYANQNWVISKKLYAGDGLFFDNNLMVNRNGILVGRTLNGGLTGRGVLFTFDPITKSYEVLMDSTLGARANMIMGFDQKIYFGTTTFWPQQKTTLNRINLWNKTQETLPIRSYASPFPSPGQYILQASDSLLYWLSGGIFSYSLTTNWATRLSMTPKAYYMTGRMIEGANKTLYVFADSIIKGKIFGFNIPTNSITSFDYSYDSVGRYIDQPAVADRIGNIYAATNNGGKYQHGTIFRLVPATGQIEKIIDLDEQNGYHVTNLLLASDGMIYGLSYTSNAGGNLFSIDPATKELKRVRTASAGDPLFTTFVELAHESIPRITIQDTMVHESDFKAVIRIHLSKPLDHTLRLFFRTRPGTATPYKPNRDFIRGKGMIYVKKGAVDKVIRITVLKDDRKEGDEKFYMQILKTPHTKDSIRITKEQAEITIVDVPPVVQTVALPPDTNHMRMETVKPVLESEFTVTVSPNPSSSAFRLQVTGGATSMNMRIVNVLGVLIERIDGVTAGKALWIGSNWTPGVYFAVVQQGNQTRTVKVVKSGIH